MYFELLLIILVSLLSITCLNVGVYNFFQKKKSNSRNSDVDALCTFIEEGTKRSIKSIVRISMIFLAIISFVIFFQMAFVEFLIIPVVLFITGAVCSLLINRFGVYLLQQRAVDFFDKLQLSKLELVRYFISKGRYVLVSVLALLVFDFAAHFFVIDFLYLNNIAQLNTGISQMLMSPMSTHFSEIHLLNQMHVFKIHILILLFFHFLGFITQTIISVLYSSYFGSVSDVAVDITSFLNFDFFEDDLRNPALLADFVGDFLKKSFQILNIISCFSVGILLSVSYFVSYFYLESSAEISDTVFNHIISSIIIFTFGIFVYFLVSFLKPKTITTFKSLMFFSIKRFVFGLFLMIGLVWVFYYYDSGIEFDNFVFIVFGMVLQLVFYWLIMGFYKRPFATPVSIFSHIVYGVYRGAALFFVLLTVWVGFLSLIYFAEGIDHVRCDILDLNYFLMGFFMQLFFCLGDYLGLSFIDSSAGIRKIINLKTVSDEFVLFFQDYRLKLELIIKNSFCFLGIMFVLSVMFFYYQRLLIVLHLTESELHLDSNLLNNKVQNITSYYRVGIQNLSFDIGLILGVLFSIGILIVFVYGFYTLFKSVSAHIQDQMSDFDLIQSGKKMPDYSSILTILNSKLVKIMIFVFAVVLGVPILVTSLFGVAGSVGLMFSMYFILFLISGLGINVGTYWSYLKLHFVEDDGLEETSILKTNVIFCDNLGDLLKDLLGVSLIVIMIGVLSYFILFIPLMFDNF